jgi:hypothetical protein
MKPLPNIPTIPPIRNLEDADKAIRTLLIYCDRLKKAIEPTLPAS